MNIYYVRHGQTDWNKVRRLQGRTDNPLNEVGIEQAKKTRDLLKNEKIDLIICSPLRRTVETANIINEGRNIKIIKDEGFIERSFGKYEGEYSANTPYDDLWDYKKDIDLGENGEKMSELLARAKNSLERVINTYYPKNILIVAHGGLGRAVKCYFNGLPKDTTCLSNLEPNNCEVLKYEIRRG